MIYIHHLYNSSTSYLHQERLQNYSQITLGLMVKPLREEALSWLGHMTVTRMRQRQFKFGLLPSRTHVLAQSHDCGVVNHGIWTNAPRCSVIKLPSRVYKGCILADQVVELLTELAIELKTIHRAGSSYTFMKHCFSGLIYQLNEKAWDQTMLTFISAQLIR